MYSFFQLKLFIIVVRPSQDCLAELGNSTAAQFQDFERKEKVKTEIRIELLL